jgi:ankyrin repeat protein
MQLNRACLQFWNHHGIIICLVLFLCHFSLFAQNHPDNGTIETFFNAITENDTNTFTKMLDGDTNLAHVLYSGRLPLHIAASKGQTEMVALLLEHGADINAQNDTLDTSNMRLTPLEAAIEYYHPDICKLLLEAGADPNIQSAFGGSALHYAFTYNYPEIAGLLLDYGANPFLEKENVYIKVTPFELAITQGDGKLVPRMLGQDLRHPIGNKSGVKSKLAKHPGKPVKSFADILAERGVDLLTVAAQRGELEAAQALLKAGVSAKTNTHGSMPLLQAFAVSAAEAAKTRPSAIEQWLQTSNTLKRFDTNMNPQFYDSVHSQEVQQAAKVESSDPARLQQIRDLLIKNGADYDAFSATALGDIEQARRLSSADKNVAQARDIEGQTPLHWAVQNDQLPMTAFWLQAGSSPTDTNMAGQTPLHIAAAKNLVEHMKLLLAAHAPTDARDTNGWTPLDTAMHAQNTEAIHLLLSDKSVVPPPGRAMATPVHEAASGGDIAALVAMTEGTNNLEVRNELGLTPLQVAVLNGHISEAALLVDRGANVNVRDPDGNTLLEQILLQKRNFYVRDRPPTNWLERMGQNPRKAIYLKYLSVGQYEQGPNPILQAASFLLACGVDARATNNAGQTAVQLVIGGKTSRSVFFFNDDEAVLLKLLGSGGGNVNETDANGNTALHLAGQDNTVDRIAALIAGGADINATNHQGQTPLHKYVEKIWGWDMSEGGTNEPFQLLVKSGANVNPQDNEGMTPLHVLALADTSFKAEATKLLLDAGANPNLRDKHGRTPAHLFLMGKWPWSEAGECINLLVKAGANLSARDDQGKTPLHYLAALGDQDPLSFMRGIDNTFVTAKVDFQARDNNGNTPLDIAAKTGTRDVYDWLIKQGAGPNATNHLGQTPH